MNNPDSDYDEIYTEELIQPTEQSALALPVNGSSIFLETLFFKDKAQLFTTSQQAETERFHYQANKLLPNGFLKTINPLNMLTPKFIQAECFTKADGYFYSIPQQVFMVVAILKSQTESSSRSTIGSGVIVLTTPDFYYAFITSHTIHPPEYRDHQMEPISIKATILGKNYDCSIIDEGKYLPNYSISDDWVLIKININKNKKFKVAIPSPSIRKALEFSSGIVPLEYNTLLFGYFTKNEALEQNECKRVKDLGLDMYDVWKIIPQDQMSGSLGWLCHSESSKDHYYNCASTNCCSGGPVFECCLNIEEVLQAEELDNDYNDNDENCWNSKHMVDLLNKTSFQNRLIGIHCGHTDNGNAFCSVDNFFESYFKNVFTPHKLFFSERERQLIENEWKLFSDKQSNQ